MKRIGKLCLCLVLCMLFLGSALADTSWDADVDWTVDEAGIAAYLKRFSSDENSIQLAAGLIGSLLHESHVQLHVQDDYSAFSWQKQDTEMIDGSVALRGEDLDVRLSFLPQIVLRVSLADVQSALQGMMGELQAVNLDTLQGRLQEEIRTFVSGLTIIQEEGRFSGDAYEGGTRRITTEVTSEQLQAFLEKIADAVKEETGTLLDDVDFSVSTADTPCRYRVSVVTADDAWVGFSLTVWQAEEQVMTLSVGRQDADTLQAVLGYGTKDAIYYIAGKGTFSREGTEARQDSRLDVSWDIYTDPFAVGFPAVKAWNYSQEMSYTLSLTTHDTGDLVTGLLEGRQFDAYEAYLLEKVSFAFMRGAGIASGVSELYQGDSTAPCLVMRVSAQETDRQETPALDAEETMVEVNEEIGSNETINAAAKEGINQLMVRLFKILPPQAFRFFQ
ncbi:MAG: hypothetical protein J6N77_01925 [Lachnospiraceae bacterium]|nr:hypothetical protein [Lachnospiraceae bacterium]